MRIDSLILGAGMVLGGATAPALAQRVSSMQAGRFLQICSSARNGGQVICDAYITGMTDSFALVRKLDAHTAGAPAKSEICVPTSVTGPDMRGMVLSWISGHHDKQDAQVGEVVFQALHQSYPCSSDSSG